MAVYSETIELKDKVSDVAAKAASEATLLEKAMLGAQAALTKAAAQGNVNAYKKLALSVDQYKAALGALPQAELAEYRAAQQAMQQAKERDKLIAQQAKDQLKLATALRKGDEKAASDSARAAKAKIAQDKKVVAEKKKADKEAEAAQTEYNATVKASISELGMYAGAAAGATAAAAGLVVGLGALVVMGAKYALEAAADKLATIQLFDAMGDGAVDGSKMLDMVGDLGEEIGLSKDKMTPWAAQLEKMGMHDIPELHDALLAAASATALWGESGADTFLSITQKIQTAVETTGKLKMASKQLGPILSVLPQIADKLGKSTKQLAADLKVGTQDAAKFGDALQDSLIDKGAGPLALMGVQLSNVWGKFKADIGDLFEDVDILPFLVQVKDLFSIFGQSKASGQALRAGIKGFFDETFVVATKMILPIKHFFLQLVLWALEAYIALRPLARTFAEFLSKQSTIDAIIGSVKALGAFFAIVVGWVVLLGVVIGGWIAAFLAASGYFMYLTQMVMNGLSDLVKLAFTAGSDFVTGLVNGIVSGYDAVKDAVTGLADKAYHTFKKAMLIESPSKVMYELGGYVGAGAAAGIASKEGDVAGASAGLASGTVAGFAGGQGQGSSGSGATIQVQAEFNFSGGAGAPGEQTELTTQAVTLLFEKVAMQLGLA